MIQGFWVDSEGIELFVRLTRPSAVHNKMTIINIDVFNFCYNWHKKINNKYMLYVSHECCSDNKKQR